MSSALLSDDGDTRVAVLWDLQVRPPPGLPLTVARVTPSPIDPTPTRQYCPPRSQLSLRETLRLLIQLAEAEGRLTMFQAYCTARRVQDDERGEFDREGVGLREFDAGVVCIER